jgi:enhancing lycopene biosynthesis protein 2
MVKVGVVLSGCGVMDGSEIHEAVLTLLALSRQGAEAICMAPDADQHHVINHVSNQEMREKRNILVEAARIARGKIKNVKEVKASDVDALIFPGGYGAAKNLCTFAFDGPDCNVNPDIERLTREVHQAGKPIGAICIAPALIAKVFQTQKFDLTIGNEKEPAQAIEKMGQKHIECHVREIVIDKKNKIVTTPAYMLAKNIAEAHEGIEKLVKAVLALI